MRSRTRKRISQPLLLFAMVGMLAARPVAADLLITANSYDGSNSSNRKDDGSAGAIMLAGTLLGLLALAGGGGGGGMPERSTLVSSQSASDLLSTGSQSNSDPSTTISDAIIGSSGRDATGSSGHSGSDAIVGSSGSGSKGGGSSTVPPIGPDAGGGTTAVPEPGFAALFIGLAVAGTGCARRRRIIG